jgi:hypothetical protein
VFRSSRPPIPDHVFREVAEAIVDHEEATKERVRSAERERVARYLQRAADAREAAGLSSGAYDAGVLREAAEWCREETIWADDGAAEEFYEPDEPVAKVIAVFEQGEKGITEGQHEPGRSSGDPDR